MVADSMEQTKNFQREIQMEAEPCWIQAWTELETNFNLSNAKQNIDLIKNLQANQAETWIRRVNISEQRMRPSETLAGAKRLEGELICP